jgi:hypothetical protein
MKELYGILFGWFGGPVKRQRRAAGTARSAIEAVAPSAPFARCRGKENGSLLWLRIFYALWVKKMSLCLCVSVVIQTWVAGIAS